MTQPSAGAFWRGLLESLAVYALGVALVVLAFAVPFGGSTLWFIPVLAFGGSLWIAVWHSSHGRPRRARGAYTGTVLFLILILLGILAVFAMAFSDMDFHLN